MKPVEDFFRNPKRNIGGAVIPLIGPPGCGKTNVLIQLALLRKRQDSHKILWRGTEQGEWVKFLANNEQVVVWNHKHLDRVRVKKSDKASVEYLELEEIPNVSVREWEDPETVVENSSQDKINVVNIPGVFGNGKDGRVFFTEKCIDILEAIIRRENTYNFVDFFTDEAGDIWPCQQQLSGDLYELVASRTPPLLSQLRKQNSFLYCASHGTQDLHYFVWKIKANTIGYMSNSNVKNFHSSLKQWQVNSLDRGEVKVPPKDQVEYGLAFEEEDLEWVEDEHVDLVWEDSLEKALDQEEEAVEVESKDQVPENILEEIQKEVKVDWVKHMSEEVGMSYREITEVEGLPSSKSTISNWVNT